MVVGLTWLDFGLVLLWTGRKEGREEEESVVAVVEVSEVVVLW